MGNESIQNLKRTQSTCVIIQVILGVVYILLGVLYKVFPKHCEFDWTLYLIGAVIMVICMVLLGIYENRLHKELAE